MHGHEGELEAAGKESEHEQNVAAVAEGFDQGMLVGLRRPRCYRRGGGGARRRERNCQRDYQHRNAGKDRQRGLPAEFIHQRHANRRIEKLAERTGGRAGTESKRAPLFWQQLTESTDHEVERAAGQSKSDQHAGGEIERAGCGGACH